MDRVLVAFLLFYAATVIYGNPTGQPPRFILEPQDAVLPISRGNNPVPASIDCSHNSPNTTLTWFRGGMPMVYDDNRILHPNGTIEFRVLLERADVSVDGIEYYCQLSNAFGSVISRTALLQAATFDETAWPSNPVITNSMIDVTLGSFIMIPCNLPMANPPPTVVWTRDGTVLVPGDTTKYKVLSTEAGGGLIIRDVIAGDIGPTYQCRVTNVFVFSSRDSPVTNQLNQINRYPEDFMIYDTIDPVYTLPTGSDAEFTCLALANDVTNLEFLYRRNDSQSIADNVVRTTHDATTIVGRTTMSITGVTQDNAGTYQCLVRDTDVQGNARVRGNRNFTIQVSVPPAIGDVPGDQVFYTGDTHTIQCVATGFPTPMISYYFNATRITDGVSDDGILTLTSVTAANTGPYQCFANNVRADHSALWVVTVRDPAAPVMSGASSADTTITETANIILTIDVSADPEPEATWTLNDGDLPSTATPTIKVIDADACPGTYQAVLTITGFTDAHSGTYKVTVLNRAGSITHSFRRVKEVPAFVTSLTGTGTGDNCITRGKDSNLTCTYGGIPQPSFLWYTLSGDGGSVKREIPMSDAEYVVHRSATETILTVRTVDDGDNVKYVCEAMNTVNGTVRMGKMEKTFDICSMPAISTKPQNAEATEMGDVTFNCNSPSEPANLVMYEWFYTNTSGVTVQIDDMTKDEFNIMIAEDFTSITINEVTEDNEGIYECRVTTPLGQTSSTATLIVNPTPTTETPTTPATKEQEDFPLYVIIVIGAGGAVILLIFILLICCAARYYVRSKSYSVNINGFPHGRGRDEEDDDQPYNPQYESLPAPRPMKPPEYKPTPEYPSSSVITSRTPVPYNGSSSMMEMQKVSNTDLSKGNMYNYNSTSALTKQEMIDGVHQPRYEDFLSSDGQFV